ncbi:MAG: HAMP domain-containing sensor histidine kinase [Acidobacteriota bacterium]|jgi:two-component system sensor histidine kinase GlrK|nr:HAMP domain-containing sensor histidine kinase [Acidobacteriota bacterium]
MKITTRISLGYVLLFLLLAILVGYQVITIGRMQAINRTLSGISFRNALVSLQALRDLDLVEEYARKSFALADPDYLGPLREYRNEFERDLAELKGQAGSERGEIARLAAGWKEFSHNLDLHLAHPAAAAFPETLQAELELLKTEAHSVYLANLDAMRDKVGQSRAMGETATLVLWVSTLVVLVIGALVSFLIYRSISRPLGHLTEGTRAIAEGKFFYRLDTSRNDEFSHLARDFNTMTRRLDELDRLKKDFVSHVSHELKSPLASMLETVQVLLEEIPGPVNDRQRRLLDLCRQGGVRLMAMIGDLLDMSRIEAGVMEYRLEPRELAPLLDRAVAEMEMQARERRIAIELSRPAEALEAECDGDRLIQVLVNLLANAIRFAPDDSIIRVELEAAREVPPGVPAARARELRSDRYALISVADSGPGIPAADREKVFEKFHQAKKGGKIAGEGVGLGLAISRTLVEAHRGVIWVEDNPGGGARFRVLLPAGRPA